MSAMKNKIISVKTCFHPHETEFQYFQTFSNKTISYDKTFKKLKFQGKFSDITKKFFTSKLKVKNPITMAKNSKVNINNSETVTTHSNKMGFLKKIERRLIIIKNRLL